MMTPVSVRLFFQQLIEKLLLNVRLCLSTAFLMMSDMMSSPHNDVSVLD